MKRLIPYLSLLAFASVPLWLQDPYLLNTFITTGIFIIAAMSSAWDMSPSSVSAPTPAHWSRSASMSN